MRDAFLHFTFYILHLLQAVGVSLLFGMAVFAFGAWLRRMGVFAVARRLLWSARGAFLALALFGLIVWAGTKPNLGLGPLLRLGDGETNEVEYVISPEQVEAGFVRAHAGTNETWDFSMPVGANVHAPWRLRGAKRDRFAINSQTNAPWAFPLGTNIFDGLLVSSFGALVPKFVGEPFVPRARRAWAEAARVPLLREGTPLGEAKLLSLPDTNLFLFAPFFTDLGSVPQLNWPAPGEEGARSQFWWTRTPSNSLVVTWNDFLYNRDPSTPVSFKAEFLWNGDFVYRYDLSRCGGRGATALPDGIVTNAFAGAFNGGYGERAPATTNLTSLTFRRVVEEDLYVGDRDGDGLTSAEEIFVYGTDPGLPDTDGDGVLDGAEIATGTNPLSRDVSDADILARVDASATNEAFLAESVVATNALATWTLLDGFAADWTPGATNVLWERSFALDRTSAWQQYFVSASPSNAAPWRLEGLALEWELSGNDCDLRGTLEASPVGDSWRLPLSTNDFPTNVTLRLRATGASAVLCPTPLHLVAYAPEFRAAGGQEITGRSGARFTVFTEGSKSEIQLVVDHSRRPHRASPTDEEGDMYLLDMFSMSLGVYPFPGDLSGGALIASKPGIYSLPELTLGIPGTTGVSPVGNRDSWGVDGSLIVLSPCVSWLCESHGCGYDGLGYSVEDGYYEEYYYPLDSKCLRRAWYHTWGADGDGWVHDKCELLVSSGVEEDGLVSSGTSDGQGKVYVDGVEVWSGTAEHMYDDDVCGGGGSGGYHEDFLGDTCDSCDSGCTDGTCNDFEGTSLDSLNFRIPLGQPVKGQVAGFAWFSTDEPLYVSRSTFQVLAHPDAHVTDTTASGIRRITCGDARGRDLRIENIAHGVRITIYDAAQTLEHTWEIWNVDGNPEQVRLKKISRLDNVMSDETFTYDSGDWIRFDNVAQIGTRLSSSGDYSVWGDNAVTETRETYDAADTPLGTVTTVKRRVGECGSAVLRETYREENDGWNVTWSEADYWDDPQHSGRHGQPRLVWGNARAWAYTDFDKLGHETLRVEQRGDAPVPEEFPYVVSNVLYDASTLANAFVTVRDYEPLAGDSRHPDDAAKWRMETRYVVTNGTLTLTARTLARYTRLMRDGHPAIKRETWRTSTQSSILHFTLYTLHSDVAYSYEITYASTGVGTPLLMRGAVAESLSEDGTLTVNAYSLTDGRLACETRRFGPEAGDMRREVETYETTETDAAYGTILRRTTRLTSNDAIIADEQSTYDDQNRLRSTTYLDGTSLTNAYSCCRLLWKRDRQNRTTLRSARTGTDHLYNAYEETWITNLTGNAGYRVTQHFYDALGRETNTVTYAGTTPGEAAVPIGEAALLPLQNAGGSQLVATATTTYPYGGSSYSIRTDERGATTTTYTSHEPGYTEQISYTATNYTEVLRTTTRTYHGGGSSTRREWLGGSQLAATAWTEERRFTEYAPNGYRIDYVVTTSSDHYNLTFSGIREYVAVTNSISTYDLLGRLVTTATPIGEAALSPLQSGTAWLVTSNAYDGATSRILTSTLYAPTLPPRTTTYLYNDLGEQVGTVLDGITNRTDVTYAQISNEWWKVETTTVIGPSTNSLSVTRTQLTGLSASCRRHTVTITGTTGVSPVAGATTETLTTYDPSTGIETETTTSSTGPTTIRRSLHGITLSTETLGETTHNAYDAFARVVATSRTIGEAALSPLQTFTYSPAGDLLATHTYTNDTDFTTESYDYDMLGNRIATTDALGNTIFKSYDPLGQVIAEWGATYPVLYTYDTQGHRTSLTTFRTTGGSPSSATDGDTTTWTYDPYTGLCTSKTYADNSTVTYTYTPDNLPLRTTYASGKWKENVYDVQRRLSGVVYSSPDMDYELQLDAYGNVTNVTDAAGNQWRHTYGFNSLLLGEKFVHTGGTRSCASVTTNILSRSIDPFDRPSGYALSVNDTSKGGVGYAYDTDGRLSHISATNAAGRVFVVAYTNNAGYNYGYTITTPNGNAIRRVVERDAFRRSHVTNCATYFNSSPIESHTYVFDALSRPTARTTGTTGVSPVDSTFAYNDRSEVLSAAIGTNHFTHVYDDIGNHLLFGDNAVTNTYTHNNLNQITTSLCPPASPRTIHHNADGGLSSDGIWSYAYDAEDQLRSVTSRSLTNGAIRVRNTYDYRRRRISKTVQRLNVTTASPPAPPVELREWETCEERTFVYDDWNLIHETIYTIEGGVTNMSEVQYFWGLDLSNSRQGAGGVGGLLAVSRNGQFYFPSFDNNGNVTKYIDESGNIVTAYEYDDFGRIISQSGSLAYFFRHRFSTKYFDPETCLYCYGIRFYSPNWRNWLNRDPIGEEGGMNIYFFCGNDPIGQIDLLGMEVRSALAPTKCSEKDIDAEARKILIKAVALTQQGRPRLEHYGNLCCSCRKGNYEVIVTGPIPGKIDVSYSHYRGRSYKQETPASYPDDPRIQCPQGSRRVGYYHTHISSRSFSENDLGVLEARDHRYYVSQDGKWIEKAIPRRAYNSVPNVYAPGGLPIRPVVVILK